MNAYILIGGRSRRMGRSKLDLPFGASTFFDRVVDAAVPVFDDVIAVQRPGGEAVRRLATIYESPHQDEAPVFGVARALEHAARSCFVIAVDYPLVTSEVLRYIEARFRASAAPLVAPRWNGKLQMLCAGYSIDLAPVLDERIAAARFDLRGLADRGEIIEESELRARFSGEPLMNINTPDELERAASLL